MKTVRILPIIIMAFGCLMASCNNYDEVLEKANKHFADNDYEQVISDILELDGDCILNPANDTVYYMLSTSYYELNPHKTKMLGNELTSMEFSADKKMVALVDAQNYQVKVVDYPGLTELTRIYTEDYPYSAEISPSGNILAVGMQNGNVNLYNIPSGEFISRIDLAGNAVRDLEFLNDDTIIACSNDQHTMAYDIKNGEIKWRSRTHYRNVKDLVLSEDKKYVLTASNDGTAALSEINTGEVEQVYDHGNNYVNAANISHDGKYVYTVGGDGFFRIYPKDSQHPIVSIDLKEPLTSVAISPNGHTAAIGGRKYLFLVCADPEIKMQCRRMARIPIKGGAIWSVDFVDKDNLVYTDKMHLGEVNVLTGSSLVEAARKYHDENK